MDNRQIWEPMPGLPRGFREEAEGLIRDIGRKGAYAASILADRVEDAGLSDEYRGCITALVRLAEDVSWMPFPKGKNVSENMQIRMGVVKNNMEAHDAIMITIGIMGVEVTQTLLDAIKTRGTHRLSEHLPHLYSEVAQLAWTVDHSNFGEMANHLRVSIRHMGKAFDDCNDSGPGHFNLGFKWVKLHDLLSLADSALTMLSLSGGEVPTPFMAAPAGWLILTGLDFIGGNDKKGWEWRCSRLSR